MTLFSQAVTDVTNLIGSDSSPSPEVAPALCFIQFSFSKVLFFISLIDAEGGPALGEKKLVK